MKRFFALLLVGMLALAAIPALADAPRFDVDAYPQVDGSTATLPLSYALMAELTGISEEEAMQIVRHQRTTQSFYWMIDNYSELLLVYEPAPVVFEYAKDVGVEFLMKPIGRDALVFLVNDENAVPSLTHEQIVGIYTDDITNWMEVGGEDLPIIAYQRGSDSGSQVMMENQVMDGIEMAQAPIDRMPSEMSELIDVIAAYRDAPNAIGYSVYFYVQNMYMQENVRLMPVGGVLPSNETIASDEYPYTQDFYAVIRADAPEGSPQRVIFDWLGTAESEEVFLKAGYVPIIGGEVVSMGAGSE